MISSQISLQISHDFSQVSSPFFYLFNGTDWNPVHYKDFSQYCSIFLMTSSQISLQISPDFLKFFLICLVFQWDRFGPSTIQRLRENLINFIITRRSIDNNIRQVPKTNLFQSPFVSIDNNKCQRQPFSVLPLWRKTNVPSFLD